MPGPSDAAWLSRFAANRLMAYIGEGADAREAVAAALFDAQTAFGQLQRRAPVETYEMPFASMMLAVLDDGALDFAWYGDCAALIGRPGAVRRDCRRGARQARAAKAIGFARWQPAKAKKRRRRACAKYFCRRCARCAISSTRRAAAGCSVPTSTRPIMSIKCARMISAGTHLLLVTDGFLALASDYGALHIDTLFEAAKNAGLAALGGELRAIEDADPEGRQFPRFKKSDDATALLLRVA